MCSVIFGHIAHVDDDRCQDDSNGPPPDNWKRPPGRFHVMWTNIIQEDLRAYNLTLNEAVELAQNRFLWMLMSTSGATHS